MPDGLQKWWDERDVGGTLREVLLAVVDAIFCQVKPSMVSYIAYNRIFVD